MACREPHRQEAEAVPPESGSSPIVLAKNCRYQKLDPDSKTTTFGPIHQGGLIDPRYLLPTLMPDIV